jgi:hypothetical protein
VAHGFACGKYCSKKAFCSCIQVVAVVIIDLLTLVQSIPNWNTLFKKGSASAAAQMSPHSTGIAS